MARHMETGGARRGNGWRLAGWGSLAFLLLLPLMAMQFTDDVQWTGFDFLFMGLLFGSVGLGFELLFRKIDNTAYRMATGVALAVSFFLIWINGAVGIIGGEGEDANVLYAAVIAIGLLGSFGALFRPAGMARTMAATALAQVSIPLIAWAFVPGVDAAMVWSSKVLALTGGFTGLWLLSSVLFRRAAQS